MCLCQKFIHCCPAVPVKRVSGSLYDGVQVGELGCKEWALNGIEAGVYGVVGCAEELEGEALLL